MDRPKISSLSENQLAALIIKCFFKLGKKVVMNEHETKSFLEEVFKYQGWMFIDSFEDAFSKYQAGELKGAEDIRAQVSPMFVSRITKLHVFGAKQHNKKTGKTKSVNVNGRSAEEKYNEFVFKLENEHLLLNNPDWVAILEHIVSINKMSFPAGWNDITYGKRFIAAREIVTEWASKNFTIIERKSVPSVYIGIGTKMANSFKQ